MNVKILIHTESAIWGGLQSQSVAIGFELGPIIFY